jgi:nucleolar protein 6
MSTTAEIKLTKKQRKSVAFRERKKKGKGPSDAAILDVPEAEDQELAELAEEEDTAVGISPVKADVKGKAKAVAVDTENTFEGKASAGSDPQKRKRDDDGDVNMKVLDKVATPGETKPMKKRKVEDGEDEPGRRKILFLGTSATQIPSNTDV